MGISNTAGDNRMRAVVGCSSRVHMACIVLAAL
jgi:hypothetical protein